MGVDEDVAAFISDTLFANEVNNNAESTEPVAVLETRAVYAETNEDLHWDRPFLDTGRGGLPVLATAENKRFSLHHKDPTNLGFWNSITSPRVDYLIAGGIAGGMARVLTYPFDRARTSMVLFGHQKKFQTMASTFRTFIRDQGVTSLARGLDLSLTRIIPEIALKFAVYEEVKRLLVSQHSAKRGKGASFQERFIAGSAAGCVSHIVGYPLGVVQTRLASQKPQFGSEFRGVTDAFVKIYRTEGLLSFYRGMRLSLRAMVPAMGLDFAIYGRLKKLYRRHFHTTGQHPPAYILLACGTTSSCIAHVTIYPLLLPKLRMQASDPNALAIQKAEYTMIKYLRDIYRTEGVSKGLYRGLSPSLAKVVPAVSLSYFFYERISQYLLHLDEKSFFQQHSVPQIEQPVVAFIRNSQREVMEQLDF
ncbi:Calcium-binding mitochondrial carrier protein SCaMC-2-A [Hypsibius exemplaris]|uniref:Calcium-binding mitochondrial carrier protein SCaMC-2-A n=1 Tax=Hypsibius exemplaris TaxID=2072580 RepID=A0A1W0XDE0_HYPEX|nr:Calcium-binding mitochondrial carrier protein SCaMC-2-A [Hypsibius exemplaris]